MLVRTLPDGEYYLMVCLLRFCRNSSDSFGVGYSLAESAAVSAFTDAQAIAIRIQCTGRFGGQTTQKTWPQSRLVSVRSCCLLALRTLELDENHVQRLIANVLRGVRQRLAKQNFARLQLSFGDFAI